MSPWIFFAGICVVIIMFLSGKPEDREEDYDYFNDDED